MWTKSSNSEAVKPLNYEESGEHVILRRGYNFVLDPDPHWEYEEWQMTREQYEVYKYYETITNEQSDALVELAEMITEV